MASRLRPKHPDLVRGAARGGADEGTVLASLRLLQLADDVSWAFASHNQGRLGISSGRLALLLLLERANGKPPRLSDLARRADVSRPTVTRLVAGLDAAGLVVQRSDADDGRARRVELTPAGRQLVRRIAPGHAKRLAALTQRLTAAERAELARLLDKVRMGLASLRGL
jgi:DNA-binding MarR family transcriptional regulator